MVTMFKFCQNITISLIVFSFCKYLKILQKSNESLSLKQIQTCDITDFNSCSNPNFLVALFKLLIISQTLSIIVYCFDLFIFDIQEKVFVKFFTKFYEDK